MIFITLQRNLLYGDKNLKSLEKTVNNELVRVSDWLNANKLTLNAKKSNFVIFRPHQRKMDHSVNILMFDNSNHILTCLECKDHVKYLGVLLDSHLSWKYHIDNVALKISRIIGVIARLRHLVPFTTLIYPKAWLLWVKLLNPIYKKSSCYKNVSFG